MRKIVQISTNHQSGEDEEVLIFALCDDGTLWYTISRRNLFSPAKIPDHWLIVANVPQHSIEDNEFIRFSKKGY
jgi:hypothetical protein